VMVIDTASISTDTVTLSSDPFAAAPPTVTSVSTPAAITDLRQVDKRAEIMPEPPALYSALHDIAPVVRRVKGSGRSERRAIREVSDVVRHEVRRFHRDEVRSVRQ